MKDIFCGEDGKLSGRRIIGAACIGAGVAAGFVGMFVDGDWTRFIPFGGLIFSGLFLWGMITVQNIQSVVAAVKGQK
jgi:hypothetical protein